MRQQDLTDRAEQQIARYRASQWHRQHQGCCRFTPSCSHYAEQVLARHGLPVALLLVAWRVLRCNPLLAHPSRRVIRKAVGVLTLAAFTTLTITATAAAASAPSLQGATRVTDAADIPGGCRATVGGRPIGQLDVDHPLQVSKGQAVVLSGSAPSGSTPGPGVTSAKIHFIKDLATTSTFEPTTGTTFNHSVNVDRYLKYGSGVYRVDARSHGPRWDCYATFYLEMHGSKLAAETAIAVGGLGAIGTVVATRGKEPETEGSDKDKADAAAMAVDEQMTQLEEDRYRSEEREKEETGANINKTVDTFANTAVTTGSGCLTALLMLLILAAQDNTVVMAVPPVRGSSTRVWVKGHTVWGFISGLFCGLGLLVAGWQYNLYPLTKTNIALPVVVAIIGAVRARLGRAWKVG